MLSTALRQRPRLLSVMAKRTLSDAASSSSSSTRSTRALQLSRLPIPRLRDTLERYLKSVEPFLLEDEARGGPSFQESMAKRTAWAKEFEMGLGKTVQERLIGLSHAQAVN